MDRETVSFGVALDALKAKECVAITRIDWYGTSAEPVVRLQTVDEYSFMTEPYLYMEKNDGKGGKKRFPLDLSCESILSDSWVILK